MKEQYNTMMKQMKLSDTGRSAIEKNLTTGGKIRRTTPLRLGLAAACVCIVLIGGVFAAERLGRVEMNDPQSGADHSEYNVSVDLTQEERLFSDCLVSDLNNGTLQRAFMDRSELENYLGFPLIRSETLESAPINGHLEEDFAHNWNLRPELAVAPDARYVLTGMSYDGGEMEGFPEVLKISTHRVVENFEVYIDARIITGSVDGTIDLMGEEFKPEPLIDHKLVVDENGYLILDENGNAIMETTQYESAEKIFYSETYLMSNGIQATIVTIETVDSWVLEQRAEGKDVMGFCEYIAYFVHDGVLYSVRPWAVYDNSLPVDGSPLITLKHVLDSFA